MTCSNYSCSGSWSTCNRCSSCGCTASCCSPCLSREQRGENARRVIRPGRSSPQGRVVLLVDDICTTGSSLAAAVSVLRGQGARQVIAAAAAVTPED